MASVNASDIHIKSDAVPRVRVGGDLKTLKIEPLSPQEVDSMVEEMLTSEQLADFREHGTLDLAYALNKTERFRVNIFRQRGSTSLVARRINPKVPNYQDLAVAGGFFEDRGSGAGADHSGGDHGIGKVDDDRGDGRTDQRCEERAYRDD